MKCRNTPAKSRFRRFLHRLACAECRRHRMVDEAIAQVVTSMRTVEAPSLSKAFLNTLPIPESKRSSSLCWAYAAFVCIVVAGIWSFSGPSRPHEDKRVGTVATHGFSSDNADKPDLGATIRTSGDKPKLVWAHPDPTSNSPFHEGIPARTSDEEFLNPGRNGVAIAFDSKLVVSARAFLPKMRDEFATPADILIAANATAEEVQRLSKQVLEAYAQEARVVDERLFKNVTFASKHASFSEICKDLARQTGVEMTAGRNVADDNATLFIDSRPAREVMREISLVFGFIWERSGTEGAYKYLLKQDTASQIAEEKQRNDDVSKSLEAIAREARQKKDTENGLVRAAKMTFASLSSQELALLKSGRQVYLGTANAYGTKDGILDSAVARMVWEGAGGLELVDGIGYMPTGVRTSPSFVPFTEMQDLSAGVMLLMKVTEFGGARVVGETSFKYKAPDGSTNHGMAEPVSLGAVPGPSEKPIENAKENAKLKTDSDFQAAVTLSPKPTTPITEQGSFSDEPRYGSITEMQGSYRTEKGLQPPRPFMTTDDLWQEIHEKSGKDVVADSFSRLVPLQKFEGTLFAAISFGCDAIHYHWRLDEGFLTGRSGIYHWQRLNEVPKRWILKWQESRKKNGYLPLRGVLEMSTMTDRQLDSYEVGKSIAHQWKVPEWGIPSRPHMSGPREQVRPVCRFLASLSETQLVLAEQGNLVVGDVSPELLQVLRYPMDPDIRLKVDYIPPGMSYWAPFFDLKEDKIHDDLIWARTREEVLSEVRRRFPDYTRDEVSYSDGLLGLLMQGLKKEKGAIAPSYDLGDQRFGVGGRIRD